MTYINYVLNIFLFIFYITFDKILCRNQERFEKYYINLKWLKYDYSVQAKGLYKNF